jgi:hypothetical protein
MAVSSGDIVQATDYTDALLRVLAILGDGSGQSGYGQVVNSYETYSGVSTNDELIDHDHMNLICQDINTCSGHQSNLFIAPVNTFDTGNIIGANASGDNLDNLNATDRGFNDILSKITTIEANQDASFGYTIDDALSFTSSTRFTQWGGDGDPDDNIFCELDVEFTGTYATTNVTGRTEATAADHRRHFFNAGGDIRITFFGNSNTTKDDNWNTMFNNLTVVFGKNSTTATSGLARDGSTDVNGGGIDSAFGNFQLSTTYQIIFRKFGSDAYASNYVQVRAKRVGTNVIRFRIDFNDFAEGNPNFDERVLSGGGTMGAGIHLKRPTGLVSVPAPQAAVPTDFQDT